MLQDEDDLRLSVTTKTTTLAMLVVMGMAQSTHQYAVTKTIWQILFTDFLKNVS